MTEKGVASSDATNINSSIISDSDSDYYLVNGRKWWISGAGDPRCKFTIFMGVSEFNAPSHKKHTMIIIPMSSPGVNIVRPMKVYGYDDAPHGHMDIIFKNVKVKKSNVILGEGKGFQIAQGRLGPGRIHHCMRIIGTTERALENLIDRVKNRKVFGKTLSMNESIIKQIAKCKTELTQAKLLVLFAASKIDSVGAKEAMEEIAMIKIIAPKVGLRIIDRAIQIHGAEGVSQDTFLSYVWAAIRTLRIADGPDEVHLRSLGRMALNPKPKF
jgi:acyl-CoA dehydrogenase